METPLRTVLVDDEPLAIASLEQTLSARDDVEIIASFQNGQYAAAQIPSLNADVVFLDIHMPGLSGLRVARALMDVPGLHIVFVTAFDEHALQAFRVHALDYILKPYEDSHILAALDRIHRQREHREPVTNELLAMFDSMQAKPNYPTRLLVKEGRRSLIVQTDEIAWVGGAGNYVELHTAHKTYLYRQTLNQLEALLDPARFVRIHRSKMVSLNEVACLDVPAKNRLDIIMRDGSRHTVSNGYRQILEDALHA